MTAPNFLNLSLLVILFVNESDHDYHVGADREASGRLHVLSQHGHRRIRPTCAALFSRVYPNANGRFENIWLKPSTSVSDLFMSAVRSVNDGWEHGMTADPRPHRITKQNGHGFHRGRFAFSRAQRPSYQSAPYPSQADAAPPPSGRSPRRCCRTRWRVARWLPARSGAGWVGRSGGRSAPRCLLR